MPDRRRDRRQRQHRPPGAAGDRGRTGARRRPGDDRRRRRPAGPAQRRPRPGLPRTSTSPPTRGSPPGWPGARRSGSPRARSRGGRAWSCCPRDAGELAWEVNVFAAGQSDAGVQLSDGYYYLDAVSGDLLDVRPTTAELAAPAVFSKLLAKGSPQVSRRLTQMMLASLQAPQGQPVDVTGNAPYLGQVTAKGLRDSQGVALIDTTTPSYNAATGRGGIYTFTADGSSSNSALPGRQYVEDSTADQRPRRHRRPEGQPDRLRLLREHRPQLLGRQGRLDGVDRSTSATASSATPSSARASSRWSTATRARDPAATCSWSPSTSPATRSPTASPTRPPGSTTPASRARSTSRSPTTSAT